MPVTTRQGSSNSSSSCSSCSTASVRPVLFLPIACSAARSSCTSAKLRRASRHAAASAGTLSR
eukprot:scaffold56743_cov36-Phaeocystis_antarctica.AAC.1